MVLLTAHRADLDWKLCRDSASSQARGSECHDFSFDRCIVTALPCCYEYIATEAAETVSEEHNTESWELSKDSEVIRKLTVLSAGQTWSQSIRYKSH